MHTKEMSMGDKVKQPNYIIQTDDVKESNMILEAAKRQSGTSALAEYLV